VKTHNVVQIRTRAHHPNQTNSTIDTKSSVHRGHVVFQFFRAGAELLACRGSQLRGHAPPASDAGSIVYNKRDRLLVDVFGYEQLTGLNQIRVGNKVVGRVRTKGFLLGHRVRFARETLSNFVKRIMGHLGAKRSTGFVLERQGRIAVFIDTDLEVGQKCHELVSLNPCC
jgi:hypothetical protein